MLQKEVSLRTLTVTLLVSMCAIIFMTAYSFFFNFDITDEGYVLYHHLFGPTEANGLLGLHFITHPIGNLFNHSVIGYRFLDLFSVLAISAFLTKAISVFLNYSNNKSDFALTYSFITICTLGYFTFLTTGHYNLFAILSGMGWCASLLFYVFHLKKTQINKHFYLLLISLFTAFAFLSKFTFGICLAFCFPFFHIASHFVWRTKVFLDIALYTIYLSLIGSLIFFSNQIFWHNFIEILSFSQNENMIEGTQNQGYLTTLLLRYLTHLITFIKFEVAATFSLIVTAFYLLPALVVKYRPQLSGLIHYLKYLSIFTITALASYEFTTDSPLYFQGQIALRMVMAAFISAVIILLVRAFKNHKDIPHLKNMLFACFAVAVILGNPVGTNTNFFSTLSLSLGAFGTIFFILYRDYTHEFSQYRNLSFVISLCLIITLSYGIYNDQILKPYRNAPYGTQMEYSNTSKTLKGIKIEKPYAQLIDNLNRELSNRDFNKKTDRIFAYQDMPGILSALGVKSYSESWMISGYKNSAERACQHMALNKIYTDTKIFMISNSSFKSKDGALECFNERIIKEPNYKSDTIGSIWHYRSKRQTDVILSGPYIFKPISQ